MWLLNLSWRIKLMLMFVTIGMAQEDTLQSALNAVHRRQRDLTEISDYYPENRPGRYYYLPSDKDDVAFLKSDNRNNHYNDNRVFQKTLLDYLEDENRYPYQFSPIPDNSMKKRISSSFRERIENAKEMPDEDLSESFNKLENNDNEQYLDLLQQLPDKYRSYYQDSNKLHSINQLKKRTFSNDYYTNLGYDSVGMKKRSRYFEPDGPSESLYLLNYAPKDEIFERIHEDDLKSSDLIPEYYNNWNDYEQPDSKRDRSYMHSLYSGNKHFPVTKRSNPPEHKLKSKTNQQKKSNEASAKSSSTTDPKVVKELSSVFGSSNTKLAEDGKEKKDDNKKSTKVPKNSKVTKQELKNENKQNVSLTKDSTTKEVVPNATKEDPIEVKKKSINWRDYFGYDRKKKSDNNLDNEWLMERYHKAIALAPKRNTDYPLQSFHYYDDEKPENVEKASEKKSNIHVDEQTKLQEVDNKLKNIEDSIIDEALKYTGAHEGTIDSKEIQEVKDKVISRLAAAYSLEKMRQALGEYKESIAKQRKQMKEANQDIAKTEEKRISVPRKHAIDEDRDKAPEEDNSIKCAQGTEECNEQTYKTPKEILEEETQWIKGSCTKIQRACNEVADVLGNYGRTLEAACNMYQTCLLCGENTWFAPTRHCNVLFIAKSDELCDDDKECQKFARYSIRYLLDINRSLRAEPLSECELTCSDDRR